jgi:hypothetical protein
LDGIPIERRTILDEDLSVTRNEKPVDELQRGGLPRPTATKQDEGFTPVERQIQRTKNHQALRIRSECVIADVAKLDLDGGCGGRH